MRIDNDPKLDFDDVLIRPKRSEAPSRATVSLEREYQFLNSRQSWRGFRSSPRTWTRWGPLPWPGHSASRG